MSQNNSNDKAAMMAVIENINKVDGFDPTPFAVDFTDLNSQETRKRLPVMIQIAWFRLKYPEGRIAVQVTPAKDCFVATARVYPNYKDPVDCYLAEATASRGICEDKPSVSPREWAQTAAAGIALRNAGFGLQFAIAGEDFEQVAPDELGLMGSHHTESDGDGADNSATTSEEYEKNTDISPTQISRQSLRFVWWKCAFGHTRRDRVANRAVLKKRCPTCEAEFEFLLPKLLIIFYGKQLNMKVLVDDESLIGVPIDAYVPSLQLAFSFLYKGTQFEAASNGVIDHLCKVRSVQHISIQTNRSKTEIATAIRQAFGKAHVFIKSDIDEDLETIEDSFFRWRKSRI